MEVVHVVETPQFTDCVTFSPTEADGDPVLAAACNQREVTVWQAGAGAAAGAGVGVEVGEDLTALGRVARLKHADATWKCRFTPNGDYLYVACSDGHYYAWHTKFWCKMYRVLVSSLPIYSLDISPNGEMLATGGLDTVIRLFRITTNETLYELKGHFRSIEDVAFSPCGNMLASASKDLSVRLWTNIDRWAAGDGKKRNKKRNKPKGQILGWHEDWVLSLAFSPDGRCLASTSMDRTVRVWSVHKMFLMRMLRGHTQSVWSACWLRLNYKDHLLVTASSDRCLRVWNPVTGATIYTLTTFGERPCANELLCAAVSLSGKYLAVGSYGTVLSFIQVNYNELMRLNSWRDAGHPYVPRPPTGPKESGRKSTGRTESETWSLSVTSLNSAIEPTLRNYSTARSGDQDEESSTIPPPTCRTPETSISSDSEPPWGYPSNRVTTSKDDILKPYDDTNKSHDETNRSNNGTAKSHDGTTTSSGLTNDGTAKSHDGTTNRSTLTNDGTAKSHDGTTNSSGLTNDGTAKSHDGTTNSSCLTNDGTAKSLDVTTNRSSLNSSKPRQSCSLPSIKDGQSTLVSVERTHNLIPDNQGNRFNCLCTACNIKLFTDQSSTLDDSCFNCSSASTGNVVFTMKTFSSKQAENTHFMKNMSESCVELVSPIDEAHFLRNISDTGLGLVSPVDTPTVSEVNAQFGRPPRCNTAVTRYRLPPVHVGRAASAFGESSTGETLTPTTESYMNPGAKFKDESSRSFKDRLHLDLKLFSDDHAGHSFSKGSSDQIVSPLTEIDPPTNFLLKDFDKIGMKEVSSGKRSSISDDDRWITSARSSCDSSSVLEDYIQAKRSTLHSRISTSKNRQMKSGLGGLRAAEENNESPRKAVSFNYPSPPRPSTHLSLFNNCPISDTTGSASDYSSSGAESSDKYTLTSYDTLTTSKTSSDKTVAEKTYLTVKLSEGGAPTSQTKIVKQFQRRRQHRVRRQKEPAREDADAVVRDGDDNDDDDISLMVLM